MPYVWYCTQCARPPRRPTERPIRAPRPDSAAQHLPGLQHFLPLRNWGQGHESHSRQTFKIAGVERQERIPMFNRLFCYPQVVVTGPGRPTGLLDRCGEHAKTRKRCVVTRPTPGGFQPGASRLRAWRALRGLYRRARQNSNSPREITDVNTGASPAISITACRSSWLAASATQMQLSKIMPMDHAPHRQRLPCFPLPCCL